MHADIAGLAYEIVHDGTVHDFEHARTRGLPDDDLRDIVRLRVVDHVVGDAAVTAGESRPRRRLRSAKTERFGYTIALLITQLRAALRLHIDADPWSVQPIGEALGVTCKTGRARILADTDENAFSGGQRTLDAWACISLSNCSSTRSAVRRSAISRKAVRFVGEKKCSSARSACRGM